MTHRSLSVSLLLFVVYASVASAARIRHHNSLGESSSTLAKAGADAATTLRDDVVGRADGELASQEALKALMEVLDAVAREEDEREEREDAAHMQDEAEAVHASSALESSEGTPWCTRWSSRTMRWYHFELEDREGHHFAAELVRSPRAPRLVLYRNQFWAVRLTDDEDHPLDWMLLPLTNGTDDKDVNAFASYEIDFHNEVRSIRRTRHGDEVSGIEITLLDGSVFGFVGGLYLPEALLYGTLRSQDDGHIVRNLTANVMNTSASDHAVREGIQVLQNKIGFHTSRLAVKGGALGVAGGFGLSYSFTMALSLLNFCFNGFLRSIGAGTTVSIQLGIQPLSMMQVLGFTSYSGALGVLGGAAAGLGLGLAVGLARGTSTLIFQWLRGNRELQYTASEKLFSKMNCHKFFDHCGSNAIVPRGLACPAEEDEQMCCQAMTATCQACQQGQSVEEFCQGHPDTDGCEASDKE